MDAFALGVILFIMLTGHKPMRTEQAAKLSYSSLEAHEYPRMSSHSWTRLSKPAKDLVLRMLERNPANRITACEVTSCSTLGIADTSDFVHRRSVLEMQQYICYTQLHCPAKIVPT